MFEKYYGTDIFDRNISLGDMRYNQRFATEMAEGGGTRKTEQLEIQKGAKKDVYVDGKYSHSYDGRGSLKTAPQFGPMPDIESLIKQIKGE